MANTRKNREVYYFFENLNVVVVVVAILNPTLTGLSISANGGKR